MKIFKSGAKLWGTLIVAVLISFFLSASINVMCTALFTQKIGYDAYVYPEEGEEYIDKWTYIFTDPDGDGNDNGTDEKKQKYEAENKDYIIRTYAKESELSGMGKGLFLIVSQALSLILVISFASSGVYKQGFRDANLVKTGHMSYDKFKGFKIGLIGNIPFFVLFALLIVFALGVAPNFLMSWYAHLNSFFYSIIYLISGSNDGITACELNALQYVLLFLVQLLVPVICGTAYILGYKGINLREKVVYRKGEI